MQIIIDLLHTDSTKIREASSWLLNQIAQYACDLLINTQIFENLIR